MSNLSKYINIKLKSLTTVRPLTKHSKKSGFTIIEMLIVAPIVLLTIGVFIGAIVNMTGDVLASRSANSTTYSIQDALNQIDTDVKSSAGYLATNNFTLSAGQGYDNGSTSTTAFQNASTANGTMLILNSYATPTNPLSSGKNYINLVNQPNACNSATVNQNSKLMINIVYFVKDNTLWRRVVMPSTYANVGTNCTEPWQKPTCVHDYTAAFCKTDDTKLVDGVSTSGFVVNYYASGSTTANTTANNPSITDPAVRQTAIGTTNTIGVTITSTKTIAGRDVSHSSTIKSSIHQLGGSSIALSNSGGGTWAYKRPITITNSSGGDLTNYELAVSPFTDSAFVNNNNLAASYHFGNITSGSIANGATFGFEDMSGNNNSGTATNPNTTGMAWASGKFGGGISLDGIDDKVTLPTSTNLDPGSGDFTLETWVNFAVNNKGYQIIFDRRGASDQTGYILYLETNNTINFLGSTTNAWNTVLNTSTVPVTNTWLHLVVTRVGNVFTLYQNGVSIGTVTSANSIGAQTLTPAIGGRRIDTIPGGYVNGKIDEVRFFKRGMSSSEVNLLYGSAGTPKVSGDYADLRFTKLDGTELPYWQESDGKYWVKYSGALATGNTNINMYYRNTSATSSSNITNTMIFGDDFSGASVDTSKWTDKYNASYPLLNGGLLNLPNARDSIRAGNYTLGNNTITEAMIKKGGASQVGRLAAVSLADKFKSDVNNGENGWDIVYYSDNNLYWESSNSSGNASQSGVALQSGYGLGWRRFKSSFRQSTRIDYAVDALTANTVSPYVNDAADNLYLELNNFSGTMQVDWIFVRQYTATEPTHTAPSTEVAL